MNLMELLIYHHIKHHKQIYENNKKLYLVSKNRKA